MYTKRLFLIPEDQIFAAGCLQLESCLTEFYRRISSDLRHSAVLGFVDH